jgi:hypothetical protein
MEVEGRKGDTILTGADELYHDEAFRAKASPFPLVFNVNNFSEISICKPENFLTSADGPYHDGAFRAKISPPFLRFGAAAPRSPFWRYRIGQS